MLSFVFLIALCVVILAVSMIPYKLHPKSGGTGALVDYAFTIASYDLERGDRIYYGYEANVACWFVITTDPFNPGVGEELNLSGTTNAGSFECQMDGRYYVRVDFLEMPPDELATVDFELFALDDASALVMTSKPIALAIMTIVLTLILYSSYAKNRVTGSENREDMVTRSYWQHFTSQVGNWVAMVAGAITLEAAIVIDVVNPTALSLDMILELMRVIGGNTLILGLLFGMWITWKEYQSQAYR